MTRIPITGRALRAYARRHGVAAAIALLADLAAPPRRRVSSRRSS